MPGGNPGGLVVWAVTAYGRVCISFIRVYNVIFES